MLPPKRKILQPLFLVFEYLLFKRRDMFRTPVVGDLFQSQTFTHGSPFGGSTFLSVKRNNTPRHKIVMVKNIRWLIRTQLRLR